MRPSTAATVLIVAGVVVAALWGVLILSALGLAGFGRGASTRLLVGVVAPPALASLLLLAGGTLALRHRGTSASPLRRYGLPAAAIVTGATVGILALVFFRAGC